MASRIDRQCGFNNSDDGCLAQSMTMFAAAIAAILVAGLLHGALVLYVLWNPWIEQSRVVEGMRSVAGRWLSVVIDGVEVVACFFLLVVFHRLFERVRRRRRRGGSRNEISCQDDFSDPPRPDAGCDGAANGDGKPLDRPDR